ncbi:3849_t:CDS:2 [Paraglomus occultum]|uniref:3849_t:CDS:1 n=1 Tax=Paraglomus occultum TaxID=144539 RepID=A0A9N8W0Z8_9GLOM|nr:3849_t:CDS:2 [Paraglomus occultum]
MSSQEPYRSSIPVIQQSPSRSPSLFSPLSSSLEPLVRPLPRTSSLPVSSLPQQIHQLTLPSNAFVCSKKSSRHDSFSSTNATDYSSDRKSSVGSLQNECLEKAHSHHSCENQYVYLLPPPEYSSESKDHGHSEDGDRAETVLSLNDVEEVERKMDEYEKMEAQVRMVATYEAKIVIQTFLITIGVFASLVVFTLQSRINFSSWAPFLYAGLWVIIFSGIIGWLLPFDRAYHVAISVLSAAVFCGYILYDTYMLFIKLSPEEYIIAAIDLYLDVINLFIALLVLLGGMDTK